MTQKDIARDLGVSIITIQRALNDSGYVSEQLKRRIQDYAREHGYTPHRAARALVKGRVLSLALCSTDRPDFFWRDLERGINIAAGQLEPLGVQIRYYQILHGRTDLYLQTLRNAVKDGVSAFGLVNNLEYDMGCIFSFLDERNLPYITMNIDAPESKRLVYVGPDYGSEGRLAADFLSMFGSSGDTYLIVGSEITSKPSLPGARISDSRIRGFTEAMALRGIDKVETIKLPTAKAGDEMAGRGMMASERERNWCRQQVSSISGRIAGVYWITEGGSFTELLLNEPTLQDARSVMTDRTDRTEHLLMEGTIAALIYQNPILQGFYAARILERVAETRTGLEQARYILSHDILLRENLSRYDDHALLADMIAGIGQ